MSQVPPSPEAKTPCAPGQFLLAVGPPGSGKSTWADRMEEHGWWVVRPDLIRWNTFREDFHQAVEPEVWAIVAASLRGLFKLRSQAGRGPDRVLLDATNLTRVLRARWIRLARSYGFSSKAAVFAVGLAECLMRNASRRRRVPEDVLRRLYSEWEFPWYDEGLDTIRVLVPTRGSLPDEVVAKALARAPGLGRERLEAMAREPGEFIEG